MRTQTENTNVLVVLIEDDPASVEPIRAALAQREGRCRLQCAGSVPTGLARVAGGGVSLILLDLSLARANGDDALSHFHKLYGEAAGVPIVVLCRAEEESLALSAVRAGAADYMIKERCATDLERLVQSVVERQHHPAASRRTETVSSRKTGTMITLLGAKGGVGTTTLALNVGSVLARRNKAIVAELRPSLGTLSQFVRQQTQTRNITSLLNMEPAAIEETQAAACLWPYRPIAGLNLLFGPQTMEPAAALSQAHAKAILAILARLADFIVIDLPSELSDTNRAVIRASELLALVVERDPICVQAAKMILRAIESWSDAPQMVAIIVNRTALASSASIADIEMQLGIPIFGVIPPAADVCNAAHNAHTPLVTFDSESLVAESITALAERLANPGETR
jgi:MinD-like ATPase involved in chromosome partitioning or flagellar assembly/CheY-like chemotaxis protein